jgi:hypothetical protein
MDKALFACGKITEGNLCRKEEILLQAGTADRLIGRRCYACWE